MTFHVLDPAGGGGKPLCRCGGPWLGGCVLRDTAFGRGYDIRQAGLWVGRAYAAAMRRLIRTIARAAGGG